MATDGDGRLVFLGAPTAAAAYGPGQDLTPARLRTAGLMDALGAVHSGLEDLGDVPRREHRRDAGNERARNLQDVVAASRDVAARLRQPLAAGSRALVLGGDCTVEIGVVAAAVAAVDRVGLVYVDYDADLNVPDTADGRLDWMGVAHLLDLDGTESSLAGMGPRRPLLEPADIRLLGATNVTDFERGQIRRDSLHVEGVELLKADVATVTERTRAWASEYDVVLIHVDADVLDFDDFAVAENTRRVDGLTLAELRRLVEQLAAIPQARTLTLAEVNLDHAADRARADRELILLMAQVAAAWNG
ncbi:arginase family protein [Nocardioides pantholopis]|uniref:arginase family protein n=1 Tax=Nocardioides pantholopis TaxID=2483798 RepID=UPI000F091126|nr:arginase family protein [Nocardioides pantholopis]